MKTINVKNIDPELWTQARIAAVKARVTLGTWLNQAIVEHLRRDK